jgi:hypothetical protein
LPMMKLQGRSITNSFLALNLYSSSIEMLWIAHANGMASPTDLSGWHKVVFRSCSFPELL